MDLTIRHATGHDAAGVRAIYAPVVRETAISFEMEVPSVEEMAARIARASPIHPWLVAERDERVVGYAYATPFRAREAYQHSVETTVYVAADQHRTGVGRQLMRALLERLRDAEHHLVVAGVALPNDASVRLHEALGFAPVGVFRHAGRKYDRWHDVGFWSLHLRDGA